MKSLMTSLLLSVAIFLTLPAIAEERPQSGLTTQSPVTETGKERLGRKWMDEQRIDNCNVPPEKRGTKPRPAACPRTPAG
jgi:hypothetical protein